jgi:uncharacterized protein (TIGR00255 family)
MSSSMTAFGRMEGDGPWGHAIWEVRAVNHRYLEISLRLPEDLRVLEGAARERIAGALRRGKVDCSLRLDTDGVAEIALEINHDLARQLARACAEIRQVLGEDAPVSPIEILRWPGVICRQMPGPDALAAPLLELLDGALQRVTETRRREGAKLCAGIRDRALAAQEQVAALRALLPALLDQLKQKILRRAEELRVEIEPARLDQELLLLAQKYDVAEELDRLDAHLAEILRLLATDAPIGRRLDFLLQEMHREANTLGAKAAQLDVSRAAMEIKILIDQMREQAQNIE